MNRTQEKHLPEKIIANAQPYPANNFFSQPLHL